MTVVDPDTQPPWVTEIEDDADDMPVSTRLSIADTLTLGNATCGFMAVYFTTTGVLVPHLMGQTDGGMARHSAATAVMLMLLASVFDLFDGLVARKLRSSAMGAELDNLSDLISFGLAPAYFVVVWGMVADDGHQHVSAVAAIVVVLAVVLRLARFSCTTMKDGIFQGMPSPMGALTIVSATLLRLPFLPTLAIIVGVAWLMVSRVEYPKPRGRLAIATLCWIFISMGCLAAWAADSPGAQVLLQAGAALQVVMAAVIPLFATFRRVNTIRGNRRDARAARAAERLPLG
ncbi:CDP-diacylglycerol--serine O-phosphatidyltransferase [Streptomyces silvisoli]|uniref:CDP-diacylglycerol--serine O-phosphatidyltransferase n=1 Tax=Streptomyces silvisoli TaxID=3034235 RepID=A0ABT5ZRU8_9ACTN|nr:CDP-diacylglycerol--serine O-phosphatidyltransferase [Streptomyces silvisoli]MDF3292550.1 CDP-diacylglycerol--serine O-phosphatidyltransferase [Streptomyces silvisoli]